MNIPDILRGFTKQIFSLRNLIISIYFPIFLMFIVIGVVTEISPNLSIQDLTRDVAALGKIPFYWGSISQLGILFWSAIVTLCFSTYFTLKKISPHQKEPLNFLFYSGLLTAYLMLDDTYMLHEDFFPDYVRFIPEKLAILLVGLAIILFLYINYKEILRNEYGLMLLGLFFFGTSVGLDLIPERILEYRYFLEKLELLLEDGAKFTAIVTWLVFYGRYCHQQIFTQIQKASNP
jgi:hypothetical protein